MLIIQYCHTDQDIAATFNIMQQLRPTLIESSYISLIRSLMTTDSYQLVAAYNEGRCAAVAGFRQKRSLFRQGNKELYIDDLVTDTQYRSQGLGHRLIQWLSAEAKNLHCIGLVLDSGLARKEAHRFYEKAGMEATALHFFMPLTS